MGVSPMSASTARSIARNAVTRVRERASYAHETLEALLAGSPLDERDAAFATHLALGTIAWRGALEAAVGRYLRPDVRLEPAVQDALLTSAYEILRMRTPSHAAVSEGVELVRDVRPPAAGLANAVLRRLASDASTFPWIDDTSSPEFLAASTGHPKWITELLIADLGPEDAARMLEADNEPAPLFVGAEESAVESLSNAGADPVPGPVPGSWRLQEAGPAVRSGVLTSSDILVMDAGAQLAALTVPVGNGTVIELGAGRGSKTVLMARRAIATGAVTRFVAVDIHGFKLKALADAAAGLSGVALETIEADATDLTQPRLAELRGTADAVLVDAPCSGLGTLRRHPDRRWRATPAEIDALAVLGTRLLETAALLVKPGGFVVYSTCTVTRRENQSVVNDFLASEAGGAFSTAPITDAEAGTLGRFITEEGWFRSIPEPGGADGHFVARLVRGM